MNTDILQKAATEARGLAIDAVHACSSGHLGLPLGCAEIGAVLFSETLNFNPEAPKWLNRDRFILSAGHGSMFIYSWLHLSGYDVSLDQLKNFRQLHSGTPGHPENFETVGVEATTGPLGQGVGNAVGYALSAKRAAAKYNTTTHTIFNNHVVALAGDGCLQEGIAQEAIAFAGHNQLDNLILIYDANDVTLDAMAEVTQGWDPVKYFESVGWMVIMLENPHDPVAVDTALREAKSDAVKQPVVIVAKTLIGKGIPEVAGTAKAHGEGGAKFAEEARAGLGLPETTFFVSDEVKAHFAAKAEEKKATFAEWQAQYDAWAKDNPELAKELQDGVSGAIPSDLREAIPAFADDYQDATRGAGGVVINEVAKLVPSFLTGSADLFGSTKNYIKEGGDFGPSNHLGRNIWFGIREHAMGAICNGIAYDGIFRASGATFLVFADYLRPSIRLAALSKLPVTFIFTHDSVGVGEDGPTHQPVETVSGLRVIPNLDVIRPGDPEEVAGAYASALLRTDGPTALVFTRQKVKTQSQIPVQTRREGVTRGGYIAKKEDGDLEAIVLASGSELDLALQGAEGKPGVRVVSMPCMERFDRQGDDYKEEVLPKACTKRVAIEAGVSGLWYKYVGTEGQVIGIDRFGLSAPGATVFSELGITSDAVSDALA
ncbi:MAG: transketolase [Verrucomicrobiota bacterium JB023]|nr:transketolase [Verrucomicrobiota bacterium JB023]